MMGLDESRFGTEVRGDYVRLIGQILLRKGAMDPLKDRYGLTSNAPAMVRFYLGGTWPRTIPYKSRIGKLLKFWLI